MDHPRQTDPKQNGQDTIKNQEVREISEESLDQISGGFPSPLPPPGASSDSGHSYSEMLSIRYSFIGPPQPPSG